MADVYVACAMSALPPEEYEKFRQTVLSLCTRLEEAGRRPFSEPFKVTSDAFDSPQDALLISNRTVDASKIFLLIYTSKAATSSLMELGRAMVRNIPIIILAKRDVPLPYMLREADKADGVNVRTFFFDRMEDLPELAVKALA